MIHGRSGMSSIQNCSGMFHFPVGCILGLSYTQWSIDAVVKIMPFAVGKYYPIPTSLPAASRVTDVSKLCHSQIVMRLYPLLVTFGKSLPLSLHPHSIIHASHKWSVSPNFPNCTRHTGIPISDSALHNFPFIMSIFYGKQTNPIACDGKVAPEWPGGGRKRDQHPSTRTCNFVFAIVILHLSNIHTATAGHFPPDLRCCVHHIHTRDNFHAFLALFLTHRPPDATTSGRTAEN